MNESEYNFNNFDKSLLGRVIAVEYNTNPLQVGMGVPQRTPSYILGKPIWFDYKYVLIWINKIAV